jgi:hypothetical protein
MGFTVSNVVINISIIVCDRIFVPLHITTPEYEEKMNIYLEPILCLYMILL